MFKFQKQHGKYYKVNTDGGKQDKIRRELFGIKDAQIKKHNSEKMGTFRMEHNRFSDMARMMNSDILSKIIRFCLIFSFL